MGNLPYRIAAGGDPPEDPWKALEDIRGFLERGELIPARLAGWLGGAIERANGDRNELLKRLGLKRGRGRLAHKHPRDAWLVWGGRCHDLNGRIDPETGKALSKEQAIVRACEAYSLINPDGVSRTMMREWFQIYQEGKIQGDADAHWHGSEEDTV